VAGEIGDGSQVESPSREMSGGTDTRSFGYSIRGGGMCPSERWGAVGGAECLEASSINQADLYRGGG
jgi:hypothetical protein